MGSEMKGKLVEDHRERFKRKKNGGGGGCKGRIGWGGSLDPDDWNQDVRRLNQESSHRVRERIKMGNMVIVYSVQDS